MALPHIVTEMQMMRERMDLMMNAFRGQVLSDLDDLVHRTESPLPYPSIPSPYHRSFECRRWRAMMETRTLWITWNLSRPWCTFRGSRIRSCAEPFLPHWRNSQGSGSVGWCPTLLVPSKSWMLNSPLTSSGDTGTKGPLQAWWTLSNGRTKCRDPT